jgi:hypothetical protein
MQPTEIRYLRPSQARSYNSSASLTVPCRLEAPAEASGQAPTRASLAPRWQLSCTPAAIRCRPHASETSSTCCSVPRQATTTPAAPTNASAGGQYDGGSASTSSRRYASHATTSPTAPASWWNGSYGRSRACATTAHACSTRASDATYGAPTSVSSTWLARPAAAAADASTETATICPLLAYAPYCTSQSDVVLGASREDSSLGVFACSILLVE